MEVCDQGRCALDGLLTEVLQPLSPHGGVACSGNCSKNSRNEGEATPAEAGCPLSRPVYKPDQGEGSRASKSGACYIDSGNLELARWVGWRKMRGSWGAQTLGLVQ